MSLLVSPPEFETVALQRAEEIRLETNEHLDAAHQNAWGQFFTSAKLASWMASWFEAPSETIRLLDAGAGVGSLTAAFISEICVRPQRPRRVAIVAYEADSLLIPALKRTLAACEVECERAGVELDFEVVNADFIASGVVALEDGLFAAASSLSSGFDAAFLNPPYRKIGAASAARRALSGIGIETSNLYAAFVWLAARLLKPDGELIAITPRSWCNGPYFKPFRLELRQTLQFRRFHVFESRRDAFKDGDVLQENIVFHARKSQNNAASILISSGPHPEDGRVLQKRVPQSEVFRLDDTNAFVFLSPDEPKSLIVGSLTASGLKVSTGRVVDFRAKEWLRAEPIPGLAPLIYPLHFENGFIHWPRENARKSDALAISPETEGLLCPPGVYVVVKRFSSKEQKKRICAAVFDSRRLPSQWKNSPVGFENHLNYFHQNGRPLALDLAMGLAIFLNSTFVDTLFRGFNGHTQVNATDLRSLPYPSQQTLQQVGAGTMATRNGVFLPSQEETDTIVDALLQTA